MQVHGYTFVILDDVSFCRLILSDFKKKMEYHQIVNSLDPDHTRRFVWPDLVRAFLQMLSTDDLSRHYLGRNRHLV